MLESDKIFKEICVQTYTVIKLFITGINFVIFFVGILAI